MTGNSLKATGGTKLRLASTSVAKGATAKKTQRRATPEADELQLQQQGRTTKPGGENQDQSIQAQAETTSRMSTRKRKRDYFEMSGACSSYYKEDWNQYDVVSTYEFLNEQRPKKKFRHNNGDVTVKSATAGKYAVTNTTGSEMDRTASVRTAHQTAKKLVPRRQDDDEMIVIRQEARVTKAKRVASTSQSRGKPAITTATAKITKSLPEAGK